jgi:protein involved in polysaccharide export with SLBB domain
LLISLPAFGAFFSSFDRRTLPSLSHTIAALLVAVVVSGSPALHAQTTAVAAAAAAPMAGMGSTASYQQSNPGAAVPAMGMVDATFATSLKQPVSGNMPAQMPETAKPLAPITAKPVPLPSQFQRFVQKSTGRLLPVFGSELFEGAPGYTADAALPAPADYILGPGDEVRLQVWGAVDLGGSFTIDRNGQVSVPRVGTFPLAGVAVRDLEGVLRVQVGKLLNNFGLSASLGRLRSMQVYVVGQARMPGTLQISSLATLVSAVFASGGPTANGSMRNIQLSRAGKIVTTLDLYDFISRGDKSRDMALQSGDVIVITPVGARVAVSGAFDQAAIYELKGNQTTLGDILSLSGGVPALASLQKALIERINTAKVNPRQVQDIALDAGGLLTRLTDGDVVTLLDISSGFTNAVTLQGSVAHPLRYQWFDGMKILDLIPEVEALVTDDYYTRKNLLIQSTDVAKVAGANLNNRVRSSVDQINWEYAVIERLNRQTLVTELVPFNLGKAVLERDPANNLALMAGDVVTIMSQSDLRLPRERQSRLVRVEGEVAAPGVYQAQPGETMPQLLRRLGGLTAEAYVFGTEFNRESVRQRQQENLDALIRRVEAQTQAQSSKVAGNINSDNQAQAQANLQQQQTQLKNQVDRLRAMRSSGRMALELDPAGKALAALPEIRLEDGDRIFIPSMPDFVAAFGSVNNENVFLYKPGKTVSDVIKSAGLTEDAEPGQAFVLRADGSIVARRDRSGMFGGNFETLALMPGDTLVVPAQIDRESSYNFSVRALKDWTQILSNFGLGAASFKSLGL